MPQGPTRAFSRNATRSWGSSGLSRPPSTCCDSGLADAAVEAAATAAAAGSRDAQPSAVAEGTESEETAAVVAGDESELEPPAADSPPPAAALFESEPAGGEEPADAMEPLAYIRSSSSSSGGEDEWLLPARMPLPAPASAAAAADSQHCGSRPASASRSPPTVSPPCTRRSPSTSLLSLQQLRHLESLRRQRAAQEAEGMECLPTSHKIAAAVAAGRRRRPASAAAASPAHSMPDREDGSPEFKREQRRPGSAGSAVASAQRRPRLLLTVCLGEGRRSPGGSRQ